MTDSIVGSPHSLRPSPGQSHLHIEGVQALSEQQLANKAYLLGRLGREVRRRFRQILTLWSLNPSHYGVLLLLEEIDQASQQQLAQMLNIDRANMVDLLDLLEKREFVERTPDPLDRRRHIVKLTAFGKQEVCQMQHVLDQLDQEEFFVGLDDQEQTTLHTLLVKLFKSHFEEKKEKMRKMGSQKRQSTLQEKERNKHTMVFPLEDTSDHISLAGVTVRVQDLERSLEFYTQLPGVQVIVHHPGYFAMLRIGTGRLGLLQQPSAPLFHLELETPDDLETLSQKFREAGMDHVKKPTHKKWGEFDFTMQDPDGNLLEFDSAQPQEGQEDRLSTSTAEDES